MRLGSLAIRAAVGPLFVGHGTQKLFGWFGGHGVEGTGGYFEQLGLRPGKRHAVAAGAAEALGGALITLGFLTPLGATLVSGTMVTAIRKAHAKNGPWVTNGGYEYNLVLLATMVALTENGPAAPSLDDVLFPNLRGSRLAALQLGAAIAGSFAVSAPPLNEPAPGPAEGSSDVAGDPASDAAGSEERAAAATQPG
jgi:putative oxidoreductase